MRRVDFPFLWSLRALRGPSQLAPATSPAPRRRRIPSESTSVVLAFETLGALVLEFVLADEVLERGRVPRLGDGVQS